MLDTSVLLADPQALERFEEHSIVLPLVVLSELEAKRSHPELGWSARQALRHLERLRVSHGSLINPMIVNDQGGTVRVELNHIDTSTLPSAFTSDITDHRILAVAKNLADQHHDVTLVTQDLPLRLKASVAGVAADEYKNGSAEATAGWTGLAKLPVSDGVIEQIYTHRIVSVHDIGLTMTHGEHNAVMAENELIPVNSGLILKSGTASALARLHPNGKVLLIDGDRNLFDVRGRSAEQRIALDLLADDNVGIVSLGGPAGTGKSVLALAAGLEAVLEQGKQRKILLFRPLYVE